MVLFYSQNRTGHTDEIRKYKDYPNKYLITVVFVTLSKNAMYNFPPLCYPLSSTFLSLSWKKREKIDSFLWSNIFSN